MKEISTRPRILTNRKEVLTVEAGMKLSEANTEKTKKKCTESVSGRRMDAEHKRRGDNFKRN